MSDRLQNHESYVLCIVIRHKRLISCLASLLLNIPTFPAYAMQPDHELLADREFLSQHGCELSDVELADAQGAQDWARVEQLLNASIAQGQPDRAALVAWARVFTLRGQLKDALRVLDKARDTPRRCSLTAPYVAMTYPEDFDLAIIHVYRSYVLDKLGFDTLAEEAESEAETLLVKALGGQYHGEVPREVVDRAIQAFPFLNAQDQVK